MVSCEFTYDLPAGTVVKDDMLLKISNQFDYVYNSKSNRIEKTALDIIK